jgi:hypothetical protein
MASNHPLSPAAVPDRASAVDPGFRRSSQQVLTVAMVAVISG